jgi:hypothetical protein
VAKDYVPPPFHENRPDLVLPVPVDRLGLDGPTRRQSRSDRWRRSSHGFYVPSHTDASVPEQQIVEASVLMPSDAAITGWAALRWGGASWFDGTHKRGSERSPVVIASCDQDIRPQHGVEICQERLDPREITALDGLAITSAARSACFEMRYAATLRDAVVFLDMTAFFDLASTAEVTAYALAHPGWTGIPRARDAVLLADENSWSAMETLMRLIWVINAGLDHPLCNRPIFDLDGRLIGTPDIFDPEAGLAGEYDSALHLPGERRAKDVRREAEFRNHGLEFFVVVTDDMRDQDMVAERMWDARSRALRNKLPRRWTLTPPPWWQESHTVEQRRALTGRAREAVLRLRRRTA